MQTRELCSGSVLQERAAGAGSLVCTDPKKLMCLDGSLGPEGWCPLESHQQCTVECKMWQLAVLSYESSPH